MSATRLPNPSLSAPASELTVALVGNPNTGKSTLFNALAGMNQRVGNYPGVTVEKKIGRTKIENTRVIVIDLPGTYSLSPKSPDELVTFDVLAGRKPGEPIPQLIICVVDANNLERNLYLCSQVLEMNLPVVIALNMVDVAKRNQIEIDVAKLSEKLDVPVIPIQANRKLGLDELRRAVISARESASLRHAVFSTEFLTTIEPVRNHLINARPTPHADFLARRMVLDTSNLVAESQLDEGLNVKIEAAREILRKQHRSLAAIESIARYRWIENLLEGVLARQDKQAVLWGDRLDKVLTHRVWGSLVFVALMAIVFQAIFAWAGPVMEGIEGLVGIASDWVTRTMPDGMLKSLVADGVMAGVGGVIIFLPQIFILFFFIAILEDCGYMSRAAFLMDKLMSRIGLSGKSFIPLLSSFACAIPGVMATRVIENPRDRLITMLVAPLMSCSARIPVYVLLIAAFIPNTSYLGGVLGLQGITMFAMYSIGVVVAVIVAFVLRKTLLRGPTPPFVMELPEYKFPGISTVMRRMFGQGWAFVKRAGTLIFCVSVIVWALAYFPRHPDTEAGVRASFAEAREQVELKIAAGDGEPEELDQLQQEIDNEVSSVYLQKSFLGQMGKAIEPLVLPLGWDWKIAAATIASFPAREVIVGTLGVIYSVGADADEETELLRDRLRNATWDGSDRKVYNAPVALSIMVFFALCAQCVSTLAIMRRETASWRWPIFTFVYMTVLAYVGALITYQVGSYFLL